MSVSELAAALLKELLSEDVDGLEKDYYRRILGRIKELEEKAELKGEAEFIRNTLRYLFLYRLEKEISYIRRRGELPEVELPEEEERVLALVKHVLSTISGVEDAGRSVELAVSRVAGGRERATITPRKVPSRKRREYDGSLVVFLQPHPKILDKGLSLGPFSKGDVAYIPRKFARELEEKGVVEILEGE